MSRSLLLITTSFPYPCVTEEVFVVPELRHLVAEFDRVIVAPVKGAGKASDISLHGVDVDLSLAERRHCRRLHLFNKNVVGAVPSLLGESSTFRIFASKVAYCVNVVALGSNIRRLIARRGLDPHRLVIYTFWFDYTATAAATVAAELGATAVSRGHGYDVYDSRFGTHRPRFLRRLTLEHLSSLHVVARSGMEALSALYPGFESKMAVSPLGSEKPDRTTMARSSGSDEPIELLSVARVAPEKRVMLNLRVAVELARQCPNRQVHWTHAGSGPLMGELTRAVRTEPLPSNLSVNLLGEVSHDCVHRLYTASPVDFTLLLSDSEGSPLSLCESLSYGVVPVVTAVGGVPEMVAADADGGDCAVVVDRESPAADIALRMVELLADDARRQTMSTGAFARWQDAFDAQRLRREFAHTIARLP